MRCVLLPLLFLITVLAPVSESAENSDSNGENLIPLTDTESDEAVSADPQTRRSGTVVAVIDMQKVFGAHTGFKRQMEALKKDLMSFAEDIQDDKVAMTERAKELRNLAPSSQEFQELRRELQKAEADLREQMTTQQRRAMEQEALLYYKTYEDVRNHISEVCDIQGIQLVARYDSSPIFADNVKSIGNALKRTIVFQKDLDITNDVIRRVKVTDVVPTDEDE